MPREERRVLTPQPGTVVGQKYRILRTLGEGGMGTVYEAENALTLKHAAIKWLHPRLIEVEDAAKRLLHEARATARIRHRNVVDIYDVVAEDGSVFLVMELLEGEQLSARLASEELLLPDLIQLLLPALEGVAAAHAVHVVHRDIKPDNIFLARAHGTGEIVPKIIDFGISRVFEADGSRLTRSGMTMGTPKYVSYEQLRGARDVDGRADVYAFGVILYEAIVGAPPYEAATLGEQAISFVTTEPAEPAELCPDLPKQLSDLIARTIHRDRDQRVPSMRALIEALTPFASAASYPVPIKVRPLKAASRRTPRSHSGLTTAAHDDLPLAQSELAGHPLVSRPSPAPRLKSPARARKVGLGLLAALLLGVVTLSLRTDRSASSASARPAPSQDPSAKGEPQESSLGQDVPSAPALGGSGLAAGGEPHAAPVQAAAPLEDAAAPKSEASLPTPSQRRAAKGTVVRSTSASPQPLQSKREGQGDTPASDEKVTPATSSAPGAAVEAGARARSQDTAGSASQPGSLPADLLHRAGGLRREEF
jgi:eukaryotic-like serine/threonine-protein kinase